MKIALYKAVRPGIQGVFNIIVRWWTNGPYSHCEAVLATGPDGASECASSSFLDGGVRIKSIKLDSDHWDFLEVQANPAQVRAWFAERVGLPYDLVGLLRFVGPRGDGDKARWYCSEAVCAALGWSEPWRFDPNTFAAVLRNLPATASTLEKA